MTEMNKARFFATLHLARTLTIKDKILKEMIIRTFFYGYTLGWDRSTKV